MPRLAFALAATAALLAGVGQGFAPAAAPTRAIALRFDPAGLPGTVKAARITLTDAMTGQALAFDGRGFPDPEGKPGTTLDAAHGFSATLHLPENGHLNARVDALSGQTVDGLGRAHLSVRWLDDAPVTLHARPLVAAVNLVEPGRTLLGVPQPYRLVATAPSGAPVPASGYRLKGGPNGWTLGPTVETPDPSFGTAQAAPAGPVVTAERGGGVVWGTVTALNDQGRPAAFLAAASVNGTTRGSLQAARGGAPRVTGADLSLPDPVDHPEAYDLTIAATGDSAPARVDAYRDGTELVASAEFRGAQAGKPASLHLHLIAAPDRGDPLDVYVTDAAGRVSAPERLRFP
ncbi:MAG TPA: hypothetical protein VHN99_01240 [Deinococcales bacterium]|nr:hypothetical protein [Deinococcales bacterium]